MRQLNRYPEDWATNGQEARATLADEFIRRVRVEEFERRAAVSHAYKLGRLLVVTGRKFLRVEPMDRHKRHVGAQILPRTSLPPDAIYPLWSRVNFALLFISLLHIIFNMYHQYKMDYNLLRVNHLLRRPNQLNLSSPIVMELQATVEHHYRVLTISGAPATHLSFAIEVLYWLEIFIPLIPYVLPQFYKPHIKDMNLYAASIFIEYEHHLLVCQIHVQEQVARFLASSRNFRRILAARLTRLRLPLMAVDIFRDHEMQNQLGSGLEAGPNAIKRMLMSSRELERELTKLAASDQLMPANSSPDRIFTWLPPLILFMITCVIYGAAFDVYFIYMLFFSVQLNAPPVAPPVGSLEWRPEPVHYSTAYMTLMILESLIITLQLNGSSIYQGCMFIGTALDMKASANHLRARVENFVRDKDQLLQTANAYNRLVANQANVQLLKIFMHYRVFVRQFKAQQQFYTSFIWTCVSITMSVPLISRLHAPYFDTNRGAKNFFIGLSLFIVTPATLCLVPLCLLHRRCQDLTKSLLYLCAHIIRVSQQHAQQAAPRDGGGGGRGGRGRHWTPIYDEHLVSALRREVGLNLCDLRDQFTTRLGMIALSYTTLLEFYFWFGLAVVSMIARSSFSGGGGGGGDDHQHQSLGGLFNDPFGVYS